MPKNSSQDFSSIAKNVLLQEAKALESAAKANIQWQEIISAILDSSEKGGRLIVCGVGKSGHIGAKIAATLASTGTPSFFLHPTEALHGDLGMVCKQDIILAISYSGESSEILSIMPHLKRLSRAIITMSKDKNSPLSAQGDYFLPIFIEREACPIDAAPMSSTTLTLAMGDALAACLINARGFSKKDFGALHPGGSLGKQLFVKISDLMQRENLPIIAKNTPLKEAIIIMSQKRLGSALIVDFTLESSLVESKINPEAQPKKPKTANSNAPESKLDFNVSSSLDSAPLIGVLSDGDLRRAMMKKDFDINAPAIKYATTNPKTCTNPNMLAKDALALIERDKIQLLIITDKAHKILGALHIHTLISAGIKA